MYVRARLKKPAGVCIGFFCSNLAEKYKMHGQPYLPPVFTEKTE